MACGPRIQSLILHRLMLRVYTLLNKLSGSKACAKCHIFVAGEVLIICEFLNTQRDALLLVYGVFLLFRRMNSLFSAISLTYITRIQLDELISQCTSL